MGDTLWAWVTEYPDGSVGTIAVGGIVDGHIIPLIGRDEKTIRSMEPFAHKHGKASNQKVWLRRYVMQEDIGR